MIERCPRSGAVSAWRTLRSVLRFRRLEIDPVARRLRQAASTDDLTPHGPAPAAPGRVRLHRRRRRRRAHPPAQRRSLPAPRVPARECCATSAPWTRPPPCSGGPCPCRWSSPRPGSPASPDPKASWRWLGRRPGPGFPTPCRPSPPARSRRWRRAAPGPSGSRSTSGATGPGARHARAGRRRRL